MTSDQPNWGGDTDDDDASVGRFAATLRDEATWAEPPADLFDRIAVEASPDSVAEASAVPVAPSGRRSWPKTLAAIAAATAAVFAAGFFVGIAGEDDVPVAAEDELVAQLTVVGTELAPEAAAAVDVFDRGAGYALILRTTGLEPAPAGGYYEGWLNSDDDVAVSIGTFHMRGGDGTVVLWSGVAVADFPLLTVSRHTAHSAGDDAVVMSGTLIPEI